MCEVRVGSECVREGWGGRCEGRMERERVGESECCESE